MPIAAISFTRAGNDTWLFKLVRELRKRDSRWGLNWKRKVVGSMSHDIVNYNFGAGTDEGTTNVYSFDVILGHCGDNPGAKFENITDPNGAGAMWTLKLYIAAGYQP